MAKFTKQTIPEMLHGIMDFINGTREDALEKGEELLYYDWNDRKRSARRIETNGRQ